MGRALSIIAVTAIAGLIGFLLMYDPWSSTGQTPVSKGEKSTTDRDADLMPVAYDTNPKVEKATMDWDAKVEPVAFDAKRAMGYLKQVCDIGTRMSGTEGMKKQQELMEKHFKAQGGKVTYQKFTATQKSVGKPTEMANMIVSWKPDEKRRIIICSHYDTRPIADQDPDPKNHKLPIISANDGGSGVALMMELAHHMGKLPLNLGVDFVFFDGEEYVFKSRGDEYFFGSKYFGEEYRKNKKKTEIVYHAAILLDMIAGKDLHLPVEQNSDWFQHDLVKDVYRVAKELNAGAFKEDERSSVRVEDDHVPLNRSGIPAIDLIDFDYKHWHCLTDVPENCSGENMEQVARVVSVWMQRMK